MAAKSGAALNWKGLDKALGKATHSLAHTQALMESIGEGLVSGTRQRFRDEEAPDGQKWPQSGRAAASGGQTLTDTARLRDSIDYAAIPDMVGSNLPYARIHQLGGVIVPKKAKKLVFKGHDGTTRAVDKVTIPARPYLGVSESDLDDVRAAMADFLAGIFKV